MPKASLRTGTDGPPVLAGADAEAEALEVAKPSFRGGISHTGGVDGGAFRQDCRGGMHET